MPYIEKENGERRTDIMSFYEKKSHDTKAAAYKQVSPDFWNLKSMSVLHWGEILRCVR